jgi:cystathionine beta-synthase
MREHDVSQVPIYDAQGEVAGIVQDRMVLNHLVDHPGAAEEPIDSLVEIAYSVIDLDTTVPVLSELFTRVRIVFVLEKSEIINVLTKIDLIDYMATGIA